MIDARPLSVLAVADDLGVCEETVRRWFDADEPTSGTRVGRVRRPDPRWVATLAGRVRRRAAGLLGTSEAARELGVSVKTVRRWFDADQPASGSLGVSSTGAEERCCDPSWVAARRRR